MGFNSPYNVYRGFESRRALENVSPVDWFVPRDAKGHTEAPFRVQAPLELNVMGKGGTTPLSRRSHPKAALPEGGYRVSPIGAKSFLSAP